MKRSHQLTAFAGAVLALAATLGGCATLQASLTPDNVHRAATAGYIATATALNIDEASGVSLERYAHDEQLRADAWRGLLAERTIYALSGPHPETLLDRQADALAPASPAAASSLSLPSGPRTSAAPPLNGFYLAPLVAPPIPLAGL